jgi:inorganic pyrophosphatase
MQEMWTAGLLTRLLRSQSGPRSRSSGTASWLVLNSTGIFAKPTNYGFIPQTLDEDGDELDTLVLTNDPIPTGVYLKAKVIGVLNFEDDGEMDHKIVCVPADDRNTDNAIQSMADLHDRWKQKIEHHFNHYKDLKKPGSTKVLGWGDAEAAKTIIRECVGRYSS